MEDEEDEAHSDNSDNEEEESIEEIFAAPSIEEVDEHSLPKHMRCAAHTVNLVATDIHGLLRNLMNYTRYSKIV